jgi:putative ABC transport system permease protein
MNIFRIALRSIQHRGLASCLTMLSMALGVMLVVTVLSIHGVVSASFRNNCKLGYNLIVGPKGGEEQLTLNTVYYLGRPVENIPYEYYLEFKPQAQREQEMKTSFRYAASQDRHANALATETTALGGGLHSLASLAMQSHWQQLDEQREVELARKTKYGNMCEFAIPVCLGDYLDRFRVVGTTPDMLELLAFGDEGQYKYEFAAGRNFETKNEKNLYFEAVLGATVAKELKLKLGDEIAPSHGSPDGHKHQRMFTVVGILKPTGTPNDRAAFINIEGFYLMEGHAQPVEEEPIAGTAEAVAKATEAETQIAAPTNDTWENPLPLPVEEREISAMLVRTSHPLYAAGLHKAIRGGPVAQAIFPTQVIYNLFDFIIRPVQQVFVLLTVMICIVSGISILVSIYNSMSERRHEIAVMRALGARREHIMSIVLMESILLAFGGGLLGWLAGHGLNLALGPYVEEQTGVRMALIQLEPKLADLLGLFSQAMVGGSDAKILQIPAEIILLPLLFLIAILVGLIPAFAAYRTDVAKSLGK